MDTLVYLMLALVTVTLFAVLLLAPSCSLGYRPLLSGYTIVLYLMILYVSLSASIPIFFNDSQSFWYPEYGGPLMFSGTLAVCWLATLLFVGFYHFFSRHRPRSYAPRQPVIPPDVRTPPVIYLILVAGILLKLLYIQRFGGLHMLLVSRSPGVSQALGLMPDLDKTTLYIGFASYAGDAAACWLFLNAMRQRRALILHGVILVAVVALTFLITPKREFLVSPGLAILLGFSAYVRPLRLSQAPLFLLGAVTFSLSTLFGRILLPAYMAGIDFLNFARWSIFKTFIIKLMSADLNLFDATVVAVYGREQILDKFGGWWYAVYRPNIEILFYTIPRAIWPAKPESFVDVSVALRSIEAGVTLEATQGGNGISLVGTSWVYGGMFGLVLGMAFLGWAASFVDRLLPKMHFASPGRLLIAAVSMMTVFHLYRQGTFGWTFIAFFQTSFIFWLVCLYVTYVMQRRLERYEEMSLTQADEAVAVPQGAG